ncbi:MAG TPA: TAT-variant-translocated molybdopterin oxidoreductase [Phycisphaerae bacterium]|nr:TAT-variant-translocated molybdopterin oxidoreductase [Phycisphaerae bacterium]
MPSLDGQDRGRVYWRSLNELADTPEFRAMVERRFPAASWRNLSPPTRRQFLKLMGASLGLAGLTSCRWPKDNIVPYARRPENRTPGITQQYATAMELGGFAQGLLVTSYDGRPIKIEGNPLHPINRGATDVFAQASVLELYDPDRSKVIIRRADGHRFTHSWDDFVAFAKPHFAELRERGGQRLCILSEATSSPSVIDMRARLLKAMPQAKWYEYEPISRINELEGATLAFGKPYRTHLHLDKAKVIVCFDADILMMHPAAIKYARDFADSRTADPLSGGMSRLYTVESVYSITGSMADHRYAVRSQDIGVSASHLAYTLITLGIPVATELAMWGSQSYGALADPSRRLYVVQIARDLLDQKGRSIITVGPRQPPEAHATAHAINQALNNRGSTISYTMEPPSPGDIELKEGDLDTLVVIGGNPVFDRGADPRFAEILRRAKTSIHLSLFNNETSECCTWHIPRAHYLESWGDARAYDGTVSIIQPLIDPLYDGKTAIELLALLTDDPLVGGHDIVQRTFREQYAHAGDCEAAWLKAVHDGVIENTQWPEERPGLQPGKEEERWFTLPGPGKATPLRGVGLCDQELVFCQDYRIYDGRFANNGWLQELPDPMTRLTWDNAAIISPADAKKLGVSKNGQMLKIEVNSRSIEMPAFIMPGQAPGSVTLPIGYGRKRTGRVADGAGFDVNVLRIPGSRDIVAGARISPTGETYALVSIEDIHHIDLVGIRSRHERVAELVQEATLAEYQADPEIIRQRTHQPPPGPLWQQHQYPEHRWGMAIDLTRCTGCSACVVACTAENNIPVVGKDQVSRGRIMHWIRADRYFRGDPDSPGVAHQLVPCMHCEDAPCEQVCPFGATMHDAEGLNYQIYNRCAGTRYCSNNCPYKVRRFNWYHYQLDVPETVKMVFNPNVTVRSRGVMEKCSYCVQRIHAVRLKARLEERLIRDGEIVPACAQACPTRAIVFGDLNDKDSAVARLQASNRAYAMLGELNVKPRTIYLAKLRNPMS